MAAGFSKSSRSRKTSGAKSTAGQMPKVGPGAPGMRAAGNAVVMHGSKSGKSGMGKGKPC